MVDKITIKGCSEDSVFSSGNTTLLKINQVLDKLQKGFADENLGRLANSNLSVNSDYESWLTDGTDCEILQPGGKGWQKGKMKVKVNVEVEFIPDEPEQKKTKPASPLDDLRKKIKEEK